jgi:hypothetical protein
MAFFYLKMLCAFLIVFSKSIPVPKTPSKPEIIMQALFIMPLPQKDQLILIFAFSGLRFSSLFKVPLFSVFG